MTRPTRLNFVTCPYRRPGGWAAGFHTGMDYRAPVGTKIHATYRGRVIHAGTGGYGSSYGKHVVIISSFRGKRVVHLYAHLSRVNVSRNQRVQPGQVIGLGGETGNTNGPHLHYEERVKPFGYYNHRRPRLPRWSPKTKWGKNKVRARLGIKKVKWYN